INYHYHNIWFEACGTCTPQPSQAIAGDDQIIYDDTLSTTLAANTPTVGVGLWTIVSGEGGNIINDTHPDAIFTGQPCTDYTLAWSISNICNTTTDQMDVSFFATPTPANAGNDTIVSGGVTSVSLNANTPDGGNGIWTIVSGEGGILEDATNPASFFTGLLYTEYILQWAVYTDCDTTFADVYVTFILWQCGLPLTDGRDGTNYETVQIDNQCWMAENLKYSNSGSGKFWCYDDHYSNCEIYGVLYAWTTALWVCPTYSHLPSDNEWKILEGTVDSQYPVGDHEWYKDGYRGFDAGKNLKSTSGWYNNGNGTDLYGFGALPGGERQGDVILGLGSFDGLGNHGFWWSSLNRVPTTMSSTKVAQAWYRVQISDFDLSGRYYTKQQDGLSVRCLMDTSIISADFFGIPTTGYAPQTVNFYDISTSSGVTNSWQWDFGDGNTSTQQNPQHTYQNAGSYTVGLAVTVDYGHDSEIKNNYIRSFTTTGVWTCGEPIKDERDGQEYATVQIGNQCWMAENLKYSNSGSGEFWCYDNDHANCHTYGVLYGWTTAVYICPGGWHLPTDDEWKILEGTVDSQYPVSNPEWNGTGWRGHDAGKNLKSAYGWYNNENGTDLYGFGALPGGRYSDASFGALDHYGYWWSSTEYSEFEAWSHIDHAWMRKLGYGWRKDESQRIHRTKSMGYSVRCVKDGNLPPNPPSNPQPENSSINISQETSLSWTCSDPDDDPITYDVYFGTEATPSLVATGISDNFYNVGTLEKPTQYFWKVVARDGHGDDMTVGDVWFFTIRPCGEPIIDERDGQEYATVQIGSQCWMAENLRYSDSGSAYFRCYEDHYSNCVIYGVLYEWKTAVWVCPGGWHLPSDHEWNILEGTVDSQYPVSNPEWNSTGCRGHDAGKNLKSAYGWTNNGNGTDLYGFEALPGGLCSDCYDWEDSASWDYLGGRGSWWSSSESSEKRVWIRQLYDDNDGSYRIKRLKKPFSLSVRCLKDN
ncbi:MAG: PKD domain-containing protein, partial [Gammaproteobacteria bacterium]|nr:PKD domain-containing protein [Gammaproteobacteria bacterium]